MCVRYAVCEARLGKDRGGPYLPALSGGWVRPDRHHWGVCVVRHTGCHEGELITFAEVCGEAYGLPLLRGADYDCSAVYCGG